MKNTLRARSPRHAVPHRVAGVVFRGDKVLLAKSAPSLQDEHSWHLPGGVPDPAEDCAQALGRLVQQNTGQQVSVGPEVHHTIEVVDTQRVQEFTFGCLLQAWAPLRLAEPGHQLAWLPVDDIPGSVSGATRNAIASWRDHPERTI
ncbi:NUDIX domain-containing protein [Nakamurella antarctica]|uniref:NUDIX domain-containing protein n=1 Tax=Nakamurella antarctica TaxID=1902245 RepID=A0A3G8ZWJ8_9ACTN|nr:NUDIX domain-containing protein [Nakamurella antarctica]AZI58071.1 NUDIX domain-containing protein [Nakamurella antarctica]